MTAPRTTLSRAREAQDGGARRRLCDLKAVTREADRARPDELQDLVDDRRIPLRSAAVLELATISASGSAWRYTRLADMASTASATAMIRAPRGIASPSSPS